MAEEVTGDRSVGLSFEWDPDKAITNSAKHGVSFDEAKGRSAIPMS